MKKWMLVAVASGMFMAGATVVPAQQSSVEDRLKALEQQAQENKDLKERVKKLEGENDTLKRQVADLGGAPAVKPGEVPKDAGVKVSVGNLKLDGLMQVWFMHDPTTAFGASATGADTFRLRRGEIALNGDIMPDIGFHIMIDPAKLLKVNQDTISVLVPGGGTNTVSKNVSANQGSTILQDLDVRIRFAKMFPEIADFAPNLEAVIGQQKTPLTEEGYRSSAKLDLVERSQIGRTYGDKRDTGLLLKDSYKYVDYYMGVFNGSGIGAVDDNNDKTYAAHLVLKPIPEWKVGAFGQLGLTGTAADKDQDRWGFDTQYERNRCSFKAEYAHGRDGTVNSQGFYLQPGYYLIKDKLQLIGRYDWFDPNNDTSGNEIQEITGALNWYFYKHNAKFQFEYMRRINQAPPAGVHENEDVLLMNLQTAF
jgi:hypothetical protein